MSEKMLTASGLAEVWERVKSCFIKRPTSQTGGVSTPVYVNSAGDITKCSSTVGSGTKPVYMSSGTITASTSTVGTSTKPVYMSSGTITASTSTVGSVSTPVYMNSGTITACTGVAPLASPTFTGTPKAPTASSGTSSSQIATTAFVQDAITRSGGGGWLTEGIILYPGEDIIFTFQQAPYDLDFNQYMKYEPDSGDPQISEPDDDGVTLGDGYFIVALSIIGTMTGVTDNSLFVAQIHDVARGEVMSAAKDAVPDTDGAYPITLNTAPRLIDSTSDNPRIIKPRYNCTGSGTIQGGMAYLTIVRVG